MTDNLTFYTPISKVDEELRMVYGYASTEHLDSQGEVVKKEALSDAIDDYMKWANIREMHQPSAVGKAKKAEIDGKGLYIAAKVVDDNAWNKVKEGVYNGFSIGGRVKTIKGNEISSLSLSEISLVDRPANPECKFDVFKADFIKEEKKITQLPMKKAEEQVVKPQTEVVPGTQVQVVTANATVEVKPVVETKPVEEVKPVVEAKTVVEAPKKRRVRKGMFDVSRLAMIIEELHQLEECVEYEGEMEDDDMDEEYAKKLAEQIKVLGELLGGRVTREIEEMVVEEKKEDEEEKKESLPVANVEYAEKNKDLVKIEENMKAGKMPTEEEMDKIMEYMKMDKNQKNRDALRWEMAGKIMNMIKLNQEKQMELGGKKEEKVVEKAGKEISAKNVGVISESLKALQTALDKLTELVAKEKDKKKDNARSDVSTAPLTPSEEEKLRNGVKAGSTMTGGGHMVEEKKSEEPTTITKVEAKDEVFMAKVAGEISSLKEQIKKLNDMPLPIKAKASYAVIEKSIGASDGGVSVQGELVKAEARSSELQAKFSKGNYTAEEQVEASQLASKIMSLRREVKAIR